MKIKIENLLPPELPYRVLTEVLPNGGVRSQISSWGLHQSPREETCCHQIPCHSTLEAPSSFYYLIFSAAKGVVE